MSSTVDPFGLSWSFFRHDLADIGGDGAEIAVLGGRVDLDHRGDVVLRDHGIAAGTADICNAAQYRGRRAGGIHGKILQLREGVDLVLRRLHDDRIGHTILVVQPERRGNLPGACQIHDQTVGHIGRRDIGELGAGAIDVDVEGRLTRRLLNAGIGDAGNVPHLVEQAIRVDVVRGQVIAPDLQVDRRRSAEIQDLADDISGQEREAHARKSSGQLPAQARDVVGSRSMTFR